MKVLLDMNLSPKWVAFLQSNGIAAVHWREVGEPDAPDEQIFNHAADHDLVIMTGDLDFGTILFYSKNKKPSVVQLRVTDLLPDDIGRIIVGVLTQFASDLAEGCLITVPGQSVKIRKLPL